MSTYVMADIHGNYRAYRQMLEQIGFSDEDMLYVVGDVLDRGPHPIKVLLDLMERPNVVCLAGNHEHMAMSVLHFLLQEITDESLLQLQEEDLGQLLEWQRNGAASTLSELQKLDRETRQAVLDYLWEMDLYEEVEIGAERYLLVHAGLGNFAPNKEMWDYSLEELIWDRPDYDRPYFSDRYVITGHTPTTDIPGNPAPGKIFRKNRHIAIDCGAEFGGNLACLCLETQREFYVPCND